MTTNTLLPCPFCGFHPNANDDDCIYPVGRTKLMQIVCYESGGGCGASVLGDSVDEVIRKWNRRVSPSAKDSS